MQITQAQVMAARSIVRKAQANGDTPNPATVAIANQDVATLAVIAQRLEAQAAQPVKKARRVRKATA